jgi:MFS transporter, DHA1 family, inner membrane transport protein
MHRELDGWVITNLFLILFIGVADNQIIAPLLPAIATFLGVSVSATGLLVVVYSLAAAGAALVAGSWSDRSGRHIFLTVAPLVFALSSFATCYIQHLQWLLLCRTLTGMAAGVLSACSIAYAGDYFAYTVRGKALGYISMANAAAMVVAVPIAAYVADRVGWQKNFFGLAIAGLVVGGMNFFALPRLPPHAWKEENLPANATRIPSGTVRRLLSRPDIIACMIIAFCVSGGIVGAMTYAGAWMHMQFQASTHAIGLVFFAGGLLALVGAALGGVVSDRYAKKSVGTASSVFLAMSLVLLPFLPWSGLLVGVFALANFAAAFRQGPLTALMTELVPMRGRGAFIAMRNVASQIGIATTALLGGILFEHFGYGGVGVLCTALTLVVVLLLTVQIQEPVAGSGFDATLGGPYNPQRSASPGPVP